MDNSEKKFKTLTICSIGTLFVLLVSYIAIYHSTKPNTLYVVNLEIKPDDSAYIIYQKEQNFEVIDNNNHHIQIVDELKAEQSNEGILIDKRGFTTFVDGQVGESNNQKIKTNVKLNDLIKNQIAKSDKIFPTKKTLDGCWSIYNENQCLDTVDGRNLYNSECCWKQDRFSSGHRCASKKEAQCFDPNGAKCSSGILKPANSKNIKEKLKEKTVDKGCWTLTDQNSCTSSSDGRKDYLSNCCWKENGFNSGNRCEPKSWITCFDSFIKVICN